MPEPKDKALAEQLNRISWLMHRYQLRKHAHFGAMANPYRGQGRVLLLLKGQPEISQKDLCYLLGMRPQSLGELLSKLERNGFVTRAPSETDRRVMNVKLTPEGREAADKSRNEYDLGDVLSCLSEDDQSALSGYLARLIHAMEENIDPRDDCSPFSWDDEKKEAIFDRLRDPRLRDPRFAHMFEGCASRFHGFDEADSAPRRDPETEK